MFYDPKFAVSLSGALSTQLLAYLQRAVFQQQQQQQQQLQLHTTQPQLAKAVEPSSEPTVAAAVEQLSRVAESSAPNLNGGKQLPLDLSLNSTTTALLSSALCKHSSSSEHSISTTTNIVLAADNKPTSTTTASRGINGVTKAGVACKKRGRKPKCAAVQQQTLTIAINGAKKNIIIEAAATSKDSLASTPSAPPRQKRKYTKRAKLFVNGAGACSSSFKQLKKFLSADNAKNCLSKQQTTTSHELHKNRRTSDNNDNHYNEETNDDDVDDLVKNVVSVERLSTMRAPRKNQKSRVHACTDCSRVFSRSDMLTRHLRLHSGEKPYECSMCKQVFSRSDHLATHERTHTGVKPYQCDFCAYSACRRDMITRHMRIHQSFRRSKLRHKPPPHQTSSVNAANDPLID